jgi:hypothetical protein
MPTANIAEEVQRNRAAFQEITRRCKLTFGSNENFIRYMLMRLLNICNRLQPNSVLLIRRQFTRELYLISEWITLQIQFASLGDESLGSPMISASLQNLQFMLDNPRIELSDEESDLMLSYVIQVKSQIASLLKNVKPGSILS